MGGGVQENDSLSKENWSYVQGFNLPRLGGLLPGVVQKDQRNVRNNSKIHTWDAQSKLFYSLETYHDELTYLFPRSTEAPSV